MGIKSLTIPRMLILAIAGFFAFWALHPVWAAEVVAPTITPQMLTYSRIRYALYAAGFFWSVAILCLILFGGWAARTRDFVESRCKGGFWQVALFYLIFSASFLALRLPLMFYSGFALAHQYGLSHQSIWLWLGDLAQTYTVTTVIAIACY